MVLSCWKWIKRLSRVEWGDRLFQFSPKSLEMFGGKYIGMCHSMPSHAIACHRMPSHAIACHRMPSQMSQVSQVSLRMLLKSILTQKASEGLHIIQLLSFLHVFFACFCMHWKKKTCALYDHKMTTIWSLYGHRTFPEGPWKACDLRDFQHLSTSCNTINSS